MWEPPPSVVPAALEHVGSQFGVSLFLTRPFVPTVQTNCVDTTIANLLEGRVPFFPESKEAGDLPAPSTSQAAAASGIQGSVAAPSSKVLWGCVCLLWWLVFRTSQGHGAPAWHARSFQSHQGGFICLLSLLAGYKAVCKVPRGASHVLAGEETSLVRLRQEVRAPHTSPCQSHTKSPPAQAPRSQPQQHPRCPRH